MPRDVTSNRRARRERQAVLLAGFSRGGFAGYGAARFYPCSRATPRAISHGHDSVRLAAIFQTLRARQGGFWVGRGPPPNKALQLTRPELRSTSRRSVGFAHNGSRRLAPQATIPIQPQMAGRAAERQVRWAAPKETSRVLLCPERRQRLGGLGASGRLFCSRASRAGASRATARAGSTRARGQPRGPRLTGSSRARFESGHPDASSTTGRVLSRAGGRRPTRRCS